MLLSYVPFKTEEEIENNIAEVSESGVSAKEGLYDSTRHSFFQRSHDQDEIIREILMIRIRSFMRS